MANHASHAALPYPVKGARYTVLLPYLDADGDPTDPTTPDTEYSLDDGAAADTAEEVASPKNSVGMLTLTGAETNGSCVSIAAKAASGPKTTLATLYPRALAQVGTGTLSAGSSGGGTLGTALAYDVTGCFIRTTGGTGGGGTGGAANQARRIVTYTPSTGAFTVSPNWETAPSTDTTYEVLLPEGVTLGMLRALNPTTAGRTLVVDSGGLADANVVKLGPSGSGTAQTARDVGAQLDAAVSSRSSHSAADVWAAGTRTLTSFGTLVADVATAVWGAATRILTAATNITSTGGTTVPQTGDSYARLGAPAGASVSADIAAIEAQTDDIGAAGAGLTALGDARLAHLDAAISSRGTGAALDAAGVRSAVGLASANLDTQLAALAAYIDTEIAAILEDTGTTLPAQISALHNLSAAQVNAEVLDVIATDTVSELAAVPAANASLRSKIAWLAMLARNKQARTATTCTLYADDATTAVATATVADDGTTFSRTEWA